MIDSLIGSLIGVIFGGWLGYRWGREDERNRRG